jgi:hypothetical protein
MLCKRPRPHLCRNQGLELQDQFACDKLRQVPPTQVHLDNPDQGVLARLKGERRGPEWQTKPGTHLIAVGPIEQDVLAIHRPHDQGIQAAISTDVLFEL